jgi:hypothetical protein
MPEPEQLEDDDDAQYGMIGLEKILLMSDQDRAQSIWDRAMTPEAHAHMLKVAAWKAGKGTDPGIYQGPPVDFEKTARELEEEEPEWNSRAQQFWEEENDERVKQGLEPLPHPLGDEYEFR